MKSASAPRSRTHTPLHGIGKKTPKSDAHPVSNLVHMDPVIHERTRLAIITALYTHAENGYSFSDLRDTLSLTDGNLLTHLRTLEDADLIERVKEGAGRTSNTVIQLNTSGRKAFKNYLDQLETLVRAARGR
jgi:DNA-binding MarR family transcriptional regulator